MRDVVQNGDQAQDAQTASHRSIGYGRIPPDGVVFDEVWACHLLVSSRARCSPGKSRSISAGRTARPNPASIGINRNTAAPTRTLPPSRVQFGRAGALA